MRSGNDAQLRDEGLESTELHWDKDGPRKERFVFAVVRTWPYTRRSSYVRAAVALARLSRNRMLSLRSKSR
jgi:hypothetical protein